MFISLLYKEFKREREQNVSVSLILMKMQSTKYMLYKRVCAHQRETRNMEFHCGWGEGKCARGGKAV